MKTTLFNHIAIGTESKPLIPNIIFKALITLRDYKDIDACNYILKCYTLHTEQMKMYLQKLN